MYEPHPVNGENYINIIHINVPDIRLTEAGFQECTPGHGLDFHKREEYIIHCITSGKGYFSINDKKHRLSKGQAFLIRPGENISYYASDTDPWSYIWIGFEGEFGKKLDCIKQNIFEINPELFERIKKAARYTTMREVYLLGCIMEILSTIIESYTKCDYVAKAKAYIDSHGYFKFTVADIAKAINISADYLSQIFKKEMEIDLHQYIINEKMHCARNKLLVGFTVEKAAKWVGYSDISTFSRAYKKHFGYPPSKEKKWNL